MRNPYDITPQEEADAIRLGELEGFEAEAEAHHTHHVLTCDECDDGCTVGVGLRKELDTAHEAVKQHEQLVGA